MKTVIWFNVQLHEQAAYDKWVDSGAEGRIPNRSLENITLEMLWHGDRPGPDDEICVTDLERTVLERVEFWPLPEKGETEGVRVFHTRPIYQGDRGLFDEVVGALRESGAIDPYAPHDTPERFSAPLDFTPEGVRVREGVWEPHEAITRAREILRQYGGRDE